MQPAHSYLVTYKYGALYLTTRSSDLVNLRVNRLDSEKAIPEGSALFEDSDGKYYATPDDYMPICGTLPENVATQPPMVLGVWILGKLDFFGRRLSLLAKTPGVFALAQTHERFFNVLRIIDQRSSEWMQELPKSTQALHYRKRELTLSVTVDRDKKIYMGLSQTLCKSQKKTDLVLETTQRVVFVSQKVNKKHWRIGLEVLLAVFNSEVETYKMLLEKKAKGARLDGVLLPETILEYKTGTKLIFSKKPQTLKERIKKNLSYRDKPFYERELPKVIYGIVRSIFSLQKEGDINDADIKPKNFLIDENNNIWVIDLGLINPRGKGTIDKIKGTRGFIAPELFKMTPFVVDFDKWSAWCLGLVLLWVLEGRPLIHRLNKELKYERMVEQLKCLQESNLHSKYTTLIKGLMKEDPEQRMSIREAFNLASSYYKP